MKRKARLPAGEPQVANGNLTYLALEILKLRGEGTHPFDSLHKMAQEHLERVFAVATPKLTANPDERHE